MIGPDLQARLYAVVWSELGADLFDEDLDGVADCMDAAIQATADGIPILMKDECSDLLKSGGAKGNRTPEPTCGNGL